MADRYRRVRAATERLAEPLTAEDQCLQSQDASSPTKWHRAHTTWFWEAFVLGPHGVPPTDARYAQLFNSYYVALGPRHARPKRGLLSRPTASEITEYRRRVDEQMVVLLARMDDGQLAAIAPMIELGLAHEEQHQELILTDILHAFSQNPLRPAYRVLAAAKPSSQPRPLGWVRFEGGTLAIGADATASFCFDNEEPRHPVVVAPFEIGDRLLTIADWLAFDDAGGYRSPELWLSDGWDWICREEIRAPGYARRVGPSLELFGLGGVRIAHDSEPVAHLSFYEADAIARFMGARLPTEAEWEVTTTGAPLGGNFLDERTLAPLPAPPVRESRIAQLYGDAWEWTQSAYAPYPGFRPRSGPASEYNGKFMVNQIVLRGGSCFTPRGHVRPTYRNFWAPETRFQMTGVRLARDAGAP